MSEDLTPICCTCRMRPAREHQRDCHYCHRLSVQKSRVKKRQAREALAVPRVPYRTMNTAQLMQQIKTEAALLTGRRISAT